MDYATKADAEAAFCFTTVRHTLASWPDKDPWCEKCGYTIPTGEKIVVVYDIYDSPRCPVQIWHEECYAPTKTA